MARKRGKDGRFKKKGGKKRRKRKSSKRRAAAHRMKRNKSGRFISKKHRGGKKHRAGKKKHRGHKKHRKHVRRHRKGSRRVAHHVKAAYSADPYAALRRAREEIAARAAASAAHQSAYLARLRAKKAALRSLPLP